MPLKVLSAWSGHEAEQTVWNRRSTAETFKSLSFRPCSRCRSAARSTMSFCTESGQAASAETSARNLQGIASHRKPGVDECHSDLCGVDACAPNGDGNGESSPEGSPRLERCDGGAAGGSDVPRREGLHRSLRGLRLRREEVVVGSGVSTVYYNPAVGNEVVGLHRTGTFCLNSREDCSSALYFLHVPGMRLRFRFTY